MSTTPLPSDASLSALLHERGDRLPPTLRRLGDALWVAEDETITHAACLNTLPEFIDAELAGEPVAQLYPLVKHHLDRCDTCAEEYADLLDISLAEVQGALPTIEDAAGPDLSFLTAAAAPQTKTTPTLIGVVLKWTHDLVAVLAPERSDQVSVIAKPFFQQLRAAHENRAPYLNQAPFNLPRGDQSDPAYLILAASYLTTQRLISKVSRAEFELWLQRNQARYHLEAHALTAALNLEFEAVAAQSFASSYAGTVTAEPNLLLPLLTV